MPLPSFFKRKPPDADRRPSAPDDGSAVEQARTRARRRLIGAVVLLAAGVIGFPLVFETQPRPVSADIPIETPGRTAVAPQPVTAAPSRPSRAVVPPPPDLAAVPPEAPAEPPHAASAPVAVAAASAPAMPASPVVAKAEKLDRTEKAEKAAKADKPASKADDGARAKALLETGTAASQPKAAVRFVVQVGAYTDSAAVRDARAKVEKLGLTSYTQVVESDTGRRTRVRVGPFGSREEADSAGARLKGAGLPVQILRL